MKDLSFYFFQCVSYRINAQARHIEIYIVENDTDNRLELILKDDGIKFQTELDKTSEKVNQISALKYLKKTVFNTEEIFNKSHMLKPEI